jgi:hypothetical protein
MTLWISLKKFPKWASKYKNATLTIAAASASKVSDGFLTSPKDDGLLISSGLLETVLD